MSQVTFTVPDEIRLALKATPDDLTSRIRFAASVKLYEIGQLSSGAAAGPAPSPPNALCPGEEEGSRSSSAEAAGHIAGLRA